LMDGSDVPFINYIPGFDGYISTRYTADPKEWRTRGIMSYYFHEIQEVEVDYPGEKEHSFKLIKKGERDFTIEPLYAEKFDLPMDTVQVLDYITGFYRLNFEEFVSDELSAKIRDSVATATPQVQVTLTDIKGKVNTVKAYLKPNPFRGNPKSEYEMEEFDVDRLYAFIHDDREFVIIQYFVFDKIFKHYSDFFIQPE